MFFGLWKRKKERSRPVDPLAAFDELLENLERQASELRKSAATLLALKGELTRAVERYTRRLAELDTRRAIAESRSDAKAVVVLKKDRVQAEALLASTRESLERAESDGALLLEAAAELGERVEELRRERESASARLVMGGIVTDALKERVARFEQALVVDAARDEVERAHALADVYREELRERPD
ncbi:hypothetical protein LXT21_14055 [Myxococcus sp. K38C18041901]|uniref:hypothetical protein n=1 Tax=Myxococcus guangdongensis TaxID=2906760 RepID=UPI0020A8319F|nr:hypothetical protein [Myxococcus guangdongensis]MCP3059903.1 hypothetical protein [Myxococcus guangdongensis]